MDTIGFTERQEEELRKLENKPIIQDVSFRYSPKIHTTFFCYITLNEHHEYQINEDEPTEEPRMAEKQIKFSIELSYFPDHDGSLEYANNVGVQEGMARLEVPDNFNYDFSYMDKKKYIVKTDRSELFTVFDEMMKHVRDLINNPRKFDLKPDPNQPYNESELPDPDGAARSAWRNSRM